MTNDEKVLFAGMRSFDTLYERVAARLQDAAIRMLRDAAEAAEFLQDCKAFLLVSALSFDPKRSTFADWSERMVVNECRRRRKQLDKEEPLEGVADLPDSKDEILEAENRIDFEIALSKLPPMQKACVMRRSEGYSNGEIARLLRIDEATVRSHLRYAKTALCGIAQKPCNSSN